MSSTYLIEEKEKNIGVDVQAYLREKNNEDIEYYYEDDSTMLISKKVVKTTIIILVVVAVLLPGLFISSIKGRYYKNKLDAASESKTGNSSPEEKVTTDVSPDEKENVGQTTIQDTTKPETEINIQETDENEDQSPEEEFTPQKIGGKYLRELRPMVDSGTWNMGDAWWSPQYLNTGEEICYAIASSMSQSQDELTFYIGDQDFTQLTARYAWWNKYNTDKSLKAPAGACEIFADGESIWSSPEMDVYSMPVDIDREIPSECKQLTIIFEGAANGILMDPKLHY